MLVPTRTWPTESASLTASGSFFAISLYSSSAFFLSAFACALSVSPGEGGTNAFPPASTAVVLSPVLRPDGSPLVASKAAAGAGAGAAAVVVVEGGAPPGGAAPDESGCARAAVETAQKQATANAARTRAQASPFR